MGYTHYWTPKPLDAEQFERARTDIAKIIAAAPCAIAGWDGTGLPTLSDERIAFNGADDDACETFSVDQGSDEWSFCKTRYGSYDVVVTATLAYLAAQHGFEVSSDGGPRDWEAGVELAREALPDDVINSPFKEDA